MDQPLTSADSSALGLHRKLVNKLVADRIVTEPRIEQAFRSVPRHLFLPDVPLEHVYADQAIVVKRRDDTPISSSSQPSMMAIMLDQLELGPGLRVLEIGTATGYNAAIMDHLVGATGMVVTIDIDDDLIRSAREHLAAAGHGRVRAIVGDGGFGVPEGAPYDRIIVTVGAWDIAPAWVEQLKPDGILVVPLALLGDFQWSVAFEHRNGHLESRGARSCGFVKMRGEFAGPTTQVIPIGPEPGLELLLDAHQRMPADPEKIYRTLMLRSHDLSTGVVTDGREIIMRLGRWLVFNGPVIYGVRATEEWSDRTDIPSLFGPAEKFRYSLGVFTDDHALILMRDPGTQPSLSSSAASESFELWIRIYGEDGGQGERLVDLIRQWELSGRPAAPEHLRLRAYPNDADVEAAPGALVIRKAWSTVIVEWD